MLLVPIFSIYRNVLPSTVPRASYPPVPFQTTLTLSLSFSLTRSLAHSPSPSSPRSIRLPSPAPSVPPSRWQSITLKRQRRFREKTNSAGCLIGKKPPPSSATAYYSPNHPTDRPTNHPLIHHPLSPNHPVLALFGIHRHNQEPPALALPHSLSRPPHRYA